MLIDIIIADNKLIFLSFSGLWFLQLFAIMDFLKTQQRKVYAIQRQLWVSIQIRMTQHANSIISLTTAIWATFNVFQSQICKMFQ